MKRLYHSGFVCGGVALGDFNVHTEEDNKLNIYMSEESDWSVAHLKGCNDCKGTYYYGYGKTWEFLDTIFLSITRPPPQPDPSITPKTILASLADPSVASDKAKQLASFSQYIVLFNSLEISL